jgi:osmotically-inducible protein OsmY
MRVLASPLIAASLLSAGLLSGCAVLQEKTIGESIDETSAGTQIKTRLLATGGIPHYGSADVVVVDRLALLVGRVPSEENRAEAERIAWSVGSIDEVANELVVDGRDLLRDINDPWIASQIRARLIADRTVTGINYTLHVYDGVVYLLGFARNQDEMIAAADTASRVRGVKKVISYVKMREKGVSPQMAQAEPPRAPAEPAGADSQPPAPVQAPDREPARRGAYSDPYADSAPPPPGAGRNETIESGPIPLVR